jgi:ribonuclease R
MTKEQICDEVISLLNESGGSLRLLDISKSLKIKSDSKEYEKLVEALELMVEQEVVEKNSRRRYSLRGFSSNSGIVGTLRMVDKSGIVETNDAEYPTIVIQSKFLHTALDGDDVRVKLILQNKKNKIRGEIVEVINRNTANITGTVDFDGNFYFLIPDQKNLKIDFLIPTNSLAGARHGDKVNAEFIRWDNPNKNPQVKIKEIIGRAGDPVVEYETIMKEFNLPYEFPKEVLNEIKSIKPPTNRKVAGRLDLRKETIITIDPTTAKDFDDAVSLKKLDNGNYLLGVHIADVTHYVLENSALDKEALKRGNSVYLVDRVVSMLPEELSNFVCSLNPNEPRFTFTVLMEIDSKMDVVDYKITPAIINSKRRFSYDEVQDIIDTESGDYAELVLDLAALTKKIRAKRITDGSINFDTKEVKYILNEDKFPVDVEIHKTTESTALIEECMLLANKTVALHLKKLSTVYKTSTPLPFLYRIHDEPKPDGLIEALDFIRSLGYRVNKKRIEPADINEILQRVRYHPENAVINQVIIRAMAKAVYSSANIGHYGLGFSDYSHFTSPIRRYPDLMVHRLLKEYSEGKPDTKRLKKLRELATVVASHTSATERQAMEAERESTKLASVIFASTMVGEVFDGTISGVVQYGVFVVVDTIYCEGLLHTRDMKHDYYSFDAKRLRITGRRTNRSYALGSKVRVQIIKANIEKRQIDLMLIEEEEDD